ncbi:MAG: hypothetical protein M0Q40_12580 [Limnochordia bacterium]|nr:hypothetical protein [Limnochordia bacterium]
MTRRNFLLLVRVKDQSEKRAMTIPVPLFLVSIAIGVLWIVVHLKTGPGRLEQKGSSNLPAETELGEETTAVCVNEKEGPSTCNPSMERLLTRQGVVALKDIYKVIRTAGPFELVNIKDEEGRVVNIRFA